MDKATRIAFLVLLSPFMLATALLLALFGLSRQSSRGGA